MIMKYHILILFSFDAIIDIRQKIICQVLQRGRKKRLNQLLIRFSTKKDENYHLANIVTQKTS